MLQDKRRNRDVDDPGGKGKAAGERAGSVSPNPNAPASSNSTPMIARVTKTPRQEVKVSNWPPMMGAMIGASPLTCISRAKRRAWATPE
jgi:hypothetical protein